MLGAKSIVGLPVDISGFAQALLARIAASTFDTQGLL